MNIEVSAETLTELEGLFRFNDAVLRFLTMRCDEAHTEQSLMMKSKEEGSKSDSRDERPARRDDSDSSEKTESAEKVESSEKAESSDDAQASSESSAE